MMKLYVDMDGTLVDFVTHITEHDFWRKDKPDKVDWDKVIAEGPAFWSKMNWFPGAENAFARLMELDEKGKLDLFILSSIDFEEGIEGKRQWIQKKTAFPLDKAIFVTEPEDKARYAAPDSWLIDDRKKSLEPFVAAGGNIIEFT
jgi:5'(3')-deoxyribonucleotidase